MPKVSVIVPNYNHEKYLDRRLNSIFGQTFRDYELIFLDDASTDNSVQVFKKLSKGYAVKEIINDTNSGSPFIQWNKGVQYANGEYLWFAESDDWADKEFLSELVDVLENNSEVGIAYCQSYFIDEQNEIVGSNLDFTNDLDKSLWKKDFVLNGREFCENYEVFKNPIHNASSALIRKSVWDKVGPADESMTRCGDWLQVVKILELSDIAFKSEHLNYYRSNPNNWKPTYPLAYKIKDEEYQIFTYINHKFDVSFQDADKRADILCKEWVGRIIYNSQYSEYEKLKNVYKYYKRFKKYDHNLMKRVLKNLNTEYRRKLQKKFKYQA